MATIHLFTGENDFLLHDERKRWMQEFRRKHGEINLISLEGQGLSIRRLLDEVSVAPFLAEKRLVIVDRVPRSTKEEILQLLRSIHPSCILVFTDAKPDKRVGGVKELLQIAEVHTFSHPNEKVLRLWLKAAKEKHNVLLDTSLDERLLSRVSQDQGLLTQELKKLGTFSLGQPLSVEQFDLLVVPAGQQVIWQLLSLLCDRNARQAIAYTHALLASGESAFSVWSVLLWMLRGLVDTVGLLDEGVRTPGAVVSRAKVAFPTASSLLKLATNLKRSDLKRFVDLAVSADRDLKTGKYRATEEFPEELLALIDRFILRCCAMQKVTSSK